MALGVWRFVTGCWAFIGVAGILVLMNQPVQAGQDAIPCHRATAEHSLVVPSIASSIWAAPVSEEGCCDDAAAVCAAVCQMVHSALPVAISIAPVHMKMGKLAQRTIRSPDGVSHTPPTGPPKAAV